MIGVSLFLGQVCGRSRFWLYDGRLFHKVSVGFYVDWLGLVRCRAQSFNDSELHCIAIPIVADQVDDFESF